MRKKTFCRFASLAVVAVCLGGFAVRRMVAVGARAAVDAPGQWAGIGPSTITNSQDPSDRNSARVASIAVDPTNGSHWLVGVGSGGVWETRDAGVAWLPLTDGQPTLATGAIAFDPTDPQTIYVGTGQAMGGGMFMGGVGILKSTDGGQSWTLIGSSSFARGAIKRLRVNAASPQELVAASSRGGFGREAEDFPATPPPYGVLRSTDGGETWLRTLAGQATALEIDAANFNRQYAAIGEHFNGQGAGVSPNGVYRSSDAGQHWDLVAGPWGVTSGADLAFGAIELAMAPTNANILYASVSQGFTQSNGNARLVGLYRTDNAWDDAPSWRQISTAATNSGNGASGTYCINCQSHVIAVSPSDPNMLFAGGTQLLWRCAGCGSASAWTNTLTFTSNVHADQRAMAWAGTRLILGNDGGVWSTTDLGDHWQNHNGAISTAMFYSGALHPTDKNFIFGGLRDFTPAVRRGGSSAWAFQPQATNSEWGEADVAISSKHPDTDWMAGWIHGVIQRTTDAGKTIVRVDGGIDKSGAAFVAPVRKCPANDDVFVAGTNQLWRTNNFFSSTTPAWVANGPTDGSATSNTIFAATFLAADANCDTYAYATNRGEIRLTQDGGKTWANLDPSKQLPARAINSIAFDPASAGTLYVALSNFNAATIGKAGHVYKTTNAAAGSPTWVNVGPSDDVPFDVVVVDPRNPSLVYAGSDTGLWVSGDAAATWQKVGPDRGLPFAPVYDVKINPSTNLTVVFTHGRGAFQLTPSP